MIQKNAINFLIQSMCVAVLTLCTWTAFAAGADTTAKHSLQHYADTGKLHLNVKKQIESAEEAEVLVVLDNTEANAAAGQAKNALGIKADNDDIIKARGQHHKKRKDDLLAAIQKNSHKVKQDYGLLPIMHLKVDKGALAALLEMPGVAYVGENSSFSPKLIESLPMINAPQSQSAGFTGGGTSVASLDSAIDYTLPFFGSCSSPGLPGGCKVSYMHDFVSEGSSLADTSHGSNVAGIIVGVAPDAKVLGLNVFRSDGLAYENDIISALQWVLANKTAYNIVAVNISFGTGKFSAPCSNLPLSSVIGDLTGAGVAVTVASGNDGYSDALSYPACVPGAISVGAVYDSTIGSNRYWTEANCTDGMTLSDEVPCFSNSASFLSLLAPGSEINASDISMSGTSQASPHVAGAVALLKGKEPQLTVEEIAARLSSSGVPIIDSKNGLIKPRLDTLSALNNISTGTNSGQLAPTTSSDQTVITVGGNGSVQKSANDPASGKNQGTSIAVSTSQTSDKIAKVGEGWRISKGKQVTHEQLMSYLKKRTKKSATKGTTFSAMSTDGGSLCESACNIDPPTAIIGVQN